MEGAGRDETGGGKVEYTWLMVVVRRRLVDKGRSLSSLPAAVIVLFNRSK